MLRLGVEGKAAGWRTLRTLADTDPRLEPALLDELISRARRQADELEDLRVAAVGRGSQAMSVLATVSAAITEKVSRIAEFQGTGH